MPKLTDTQLIVLSKAAARSDGAAVVPAGMNKATVGRVGAEATGWLPHTTRAALTNLRKRGFAVERSREEESSVYRIVAGKA